MDEYKTCTKCGISKIANDTNFYYRKNKQRYDSWCRACYTLDAENTYNAAIFYYSGGTNKCVIRGCDAPISVLTLEHENFDRQYVSNKLGIKSTTGVALARRLKICGFPDDLGITVKCFAHNIKNQNPLHPIKTSVGSSKNRDHINPSFTQLCRVCKKSKTSSEFTLDSSHKHGLSTICKICEHIQIKERNRTYLKEAYRIYGYEGPLEGMSWSHTNNDGNAHRLYLKEKYGLKYHRNLGGSVLALYLIREYKSGIPNYPGLIVEHLNINHLQTKRKGRIYE